MLTSKAFLDLDACLAKGEMTAPTVATLKAKYAEAYALCTSLAEHERDALSSFSTLSVQLDNAKADMPVYTASRDEAVEALAADDAERDALRSAIAELKAQEGDTVDKNADLVSRLEMAQGELESATEAVAAEVGPVLQQLAEEAEEASREAARTGSVLESTESALVNARLRGETLQRLCAKNNATLDALRAELAAAQREPAKLALQLEGVERLAEGVLGEVAKAEKELAATRASIAAQEVALTASSKEAGAMRMRLATHMAEVAAREAELAACEALVAKEKDAGRELAERRLTLENETEAALQASAAARTALHSATGSYEKARKALKRAQDSLSEARAAQAQASHAPRRTQEQMFAVMNALRHAGIQFLVAPVEADHHFAVPAADRSG